MAEQTKPIWISHRRFGHKSYGIRSQGAITILHDRPWYRGMYFVNGRNTNFINDPEARYYQSARAYRMPVKSHTKVVRT